MLISPNTNYLKNLKGLKYGHKTYIEVVFFFKCEGG